MGWFLIGLPIPPPIVVLPGALIVAKEGCKRFGFMRLG